MRRYGTPASYYVVFIFGAIVWAFLIWVAYQIVLG